MFYWELLCLPLQGPHGVTWPWISKGKANHQGHAPGWQCWWMFDFLCLLKYYYTRCCIEMLCFAPRQFRGSCVWHLIRNIRARKIGVQNIICSRVNLHLFLYISIYRTTDSGSPSLPFSQHGVKRTNREKTFVMIFFEIIAALCTSETGML